jgi:hypothetical protein
MAGPVASAPSLSKISRAIGPPGMNAVTLRLPPLEAHCRMSCWKELLTVSNTEASLPASRLAAANQLRRIPLGPGGPTRHAAASLESREPLRFAGDSLVSAPETDPERTSGAMDQVSSPTWAIAPQEATA